MSDDPHDQLVLQIRGAVAAYERTLMAERMRRGRQMRMRAGTLLPWTTPPYGYRLPPDHPRDPATVQLDPAEGALGQDIFARYLTAGGTLLGVAKHLLQLGVRSPQGNAWWTAASLRGVLTNPVSTGHVYVGRRRARPPRRRRSATQALGKPARGYDFTAPADWTLVATVPALISQELFEQVQAKLALNKKQAVRNNKAHHYLLRALVSGGLCQSACLSRTTPQGHRHEGLSRQFYCEFDAVVLGLDTLAEALGGGGAFPRRLRDDPLCADTDVGEQVAKDGGGLKEGLEPAVSEGLQVTDQFEKTQLALLADPQRGPQGRTERIDKHDQEQAAIEIAEGRGFGFGG